MPYVDGPHDNAVVVRFYPMPANTLHNLIDVFSGSFWLLTIDDQKRPVVLVARPRI